MFLLKCLHWNIDIDNQLHCFELTNELVTAESGFESFYSFFKQCAYYKRGRNFELLRDHVLSLDETKLGDVQKLLFRLLAFKSNMRYLEEFLRTDMEILTHWYDYLSGYSGQKMQRDVIYHTFHSTKGHE